MTAGASSRAAISGNRRANSPPCGVSTQPAMQLPEQARIPPPKPSAHRHPAPQRGCPPRPPRSPKATATSSAARATPSPGPRQSALIRPSSSTAASAAPPRPPAASPHPAAPHSPPAPPAGSPASPAPPRPAAPPAPPSAPPRRGRRAGQDQGMAVARICGRHCPCRPCAWSAAHARHHLPDRRHLRPQRILANGSNPISHDRRAARSHRRPRQKMAELRADERSPSDPSQKPGIVPSPRQPAPLSLHKARGQYRPPLFAARASASQGAAAQRQANVCPSGARQPGAEQRIDQQIGLPSSAPMSTPQRLTSPIPHHRS